MVTNPETGLQPSTVRCPDYLSRGHQDFWHTFNMGRLAIIAATVGTLVIPMSSPTAHAATTAMCTKRNAVHAGRVCLPGAKKGSLTWQRTPKTGHRCVRRYTTYKTFVCVSSKKTLQWVRFTPAKPGTPLEVSGAFTTSISNAANKAINDEDPIYSKIWAAYKAAGLDIRIPIGLYPPGTTSTTPRAAMAYQVSAGSQTWCMERVANPDTRSIYYIQRDGVCF